MIERMSEDMVTVIQMVRGSDAGAARRQGLTEAQRAGLACLTCGGAENLTVAVGWVDGDHQVKVHSHHLENWRVGQPGR